jgi:hypothetical protein
MTRIFVGCRRRMNRSVVVLRPYNGGTLEMGGALYLAKAAASRRTP